MELAQIQQEVETALANSTGYDESVAILEGLNYGRRDAVSIAAAHHGLDHRDLRDETPAEAP